MKMKDRFPEVFQVDGNPSFGVQNCVWTTFGEDEQSTADQDSAIEHAVLNHDRMVEEIAELKGFVKKVSELDIETFRFEIQGGDEDYIEYVCTDIVDDAVDLLAKLNQEGEE